VDQGSNAWELEPETVKGVEPSEARPMSYLLLKHPRGLLKARRDRYIRTVWHLVGVCPLFTGNAAFYLNGQGRVVRANLPAS